MRDFRDAKAMARALRDALKAKEIETSHSECLELMAKAFGCESWNVLATKIEAARQGAGALSAADSGAQGATLLHCSFCGSSEQKVLKLIAGASAFICDACVGLCDDILEGETVLDLFAGRREAPAGYDEDLGANVERARKHAAHWRFTLEQIKQALSVRDGAKLAAAPGFAHLENKATADLIALRERHERALVRFEAAITARDALGGGASKNGG